MKHLPKLKRFHIKEDVIKLDLDSFTNETLTYIPL